MPTIDSTAVGEVGVREQFLLRPRELVATLGDLDDRAGAVVAVSITRSSAS
jgi:hypothetical protein